MLNKRKVKVGKYKKYYFTYFPTLFMHLHIIVINFFNFYVVFKYKVEVILEYKRYKNMFIV